MTDPLDPTLSGGGPTGLTLSPGTRVSHFRVLRELGRGGFGVVHLAEDLEIPGRVVALKTVEAGESGSDAEGLRHEASALAALHHPHILAVHEVGLGPSGIFLAEEYMPGGSIAQRLASGPLPEAEALKVARGAADALAAAHQAGIVHRDFKPANLLRTADGLVKVADFGLALRSGRSTPAAAAGSAAPSGSDATVTAPLEDGRGIAGTPAYMPPELFEGRPASPRGDQFAFGIALHEMLSGRRPFPRSRGLTATQGEPAVAPTIPADLRAIVSRAIARDPAARFPDMRAVVEALDRAILRRSPERRRTWRVALAGGATVVILVWGWLGSRLWLERRARALNEEGSVALMHGDRDQARAKFVAAHSADPSFLPACINLGQFAAIDANPTWAVTILRDCARRFPDAAAVRYDLGAALARTTDPAGAVEELTHALRLSGGTPLAPLVLNELARALIAAGRPAEAVSLLEAEHPDPGASLEGALLTRTLGLAKLEAGRPDEALAALEAAIGGMLDASERPATFVALGRAQEALGRTSDARASFSKAIFEGASGEAADMARAGLARIQDSER